MKELITELDGFCPNNCLHCSSAVPASHPYISLDKYQTLLDSVRLFGFSQSVFSGGEPLCCPSLPQFIDLCALNNFKVKIYTSGCGLTNVINSILDQAASGKIDKVVFSCYSANAFVHDSITATIDSFFKMNNVLRVLTGANVKIELNFVPTLMNYKELETTYITYYNFIEKFNILKLVAQGRAITNWDKLYVSDDNVLQQIRKIANPNKLNIGKSFSFNLSHSKTKCEAGSHKICVTTDGYLIPCEVFKNTKEQFQNINTIDSAEIFQIVQKFTSILPPSALRGCEKNQILNLLGAS